MKANTKESILARRELGGALGDCMEWTGSLNTDGYGIVSYGCTTKLVHRLVYQWEHPGVSMEGMTICHTCDNPKCSNPAHLFIGTMADNCKDRDEKGRVSHGESHPSSKLTISAVRAIRDLCSWGMTVRAVGAMFGVSSSCVVSIKNHTSWASVI